MRVALAYMGVVMVWSTTPLAIQWSSEQLSFISAVTLRMVLALAVCLLLLLVRKQKLIHSRDDYAVFVVGAMGLLPNGILVYWAAKHISSGLIAVLFGMYPFFVGIFSIWILKENIFNLSRVTALVLAVMGVVLIQYENVGVGNKAIMGVVAALVATAFFALSSVALKRIGKSMEPLQQLTGVLLVAAPLFVVCWWVMDGHIPRALSLRSTLSMAYLVIVGSVIGGVMFYYVIKQCQISSVALITLLTPMVAILVGVIFAGESHRPLAIVGCLFVLVSLAVYQGILSFMAKRIAYVFSVLFYFNKSSSKLSGRKPSVDKKSSVSRHVV